MRREVNKKARRRNVIDGDRGSDKLFGEDSDFLFSDKRRTIIVRNSCI